MRTTDDVRPSRKARDAAYYQAHKEERCAYNAAYYRDHLAEVSAYQATYYQEHKEEKLASNATYYLDNRVVLLQKMCQGQAEFTDNLNALKAAQGCEDCETHGGKLEHHHIDPDTKRYNISQMDRRSLDSLEEELEKCAVLCRSCHMKRHAIEGA